MKPSILDQKIKSIIPIYGISIGNPFDKSTWIVHYINEPMPEQQAQIQQLIDNYTCLTPEQELSNVQSLDFLNNSDWKITRHLDQKAMGIQTSLSDSEYQQLLIDRQNARNIIVHEG